MSLNRSSSNRFSKVSRALRRPEVVKRRLRIALAQPFTRTDRARISYLDRDWDILVILDACRYDMFKKLNTFDTPAQKVHSNGTHTTEFLEQNFVDREYPDLVYITASPQVARLNAEFAHVEHVWKNQWDNQKRTVLPEDMTDTALSVSERFPNKRLIIHYMQPHYPFIGPKGDEIRNQIDYASYGSDDTEARIWEHLAASRIDTELVQAAYEENLRLALPAVERLVSHMTGKIVVTSDHGNIFGEQVCWLPLKIYGHPPNVPAPNLTAVPWVELPWEERRNSEETETESPDTSIDQGVQQKLEDLGYV
jgi:hypothetical protein